jgi:nicotinamidase/pyrazinamidase
MARHLKVRLVIIDPNNDFMDLPSSTLPVPGATADMDRAGTMIDRLGGGIGDIDVTLDSHHLIDVGHPAMWVNQNGQHPSEIMVITADQIRNKIWTPVHGDAPLDALGQKLDIKGVRTLRDYMIWYADQLEARGNYLLTVWTTHCLIGSNGHAVYRPLFDALMRWSRKTFSTVNWVTKGTNPLTEHYGAVMAEVPLPNDPSTQLRTGFITGLQRADVVVICGEAWSHCVRATVTQVSENIGDKHLSKIHLLTDGMSSIPAIPGGPDFPAIARAFTDDMVSRGMKLTTSAEFLA